MDLLGLPAATLCDVVTSYALDSAVTGRAEAAREMDKALGGVDPLDPETWGVTDDALAAQDAMLDPEDRG